MSSRWQELHVSASSIWVCSAFSTLIELVISESFKDGGAVRNEWNVL
jgi:hypothetical protein